MPLSIIIKLSIDLRLINRFFIGLAKCEFDGKANQSKICGLDFNDKKSIRSPLGADNSFNIHPRLFRS